jgi:hypothetical protein
MERWYIFAILLSVTFRKAGVFMEICVNSNFPLFVVVFYCILCSDNTAALTAAPTTLPGPQGFEGLVLYTHKFNSQFPPHRQQPYMYY